MPELPEVETVRRGLQPAMEGSKILKAEARRKDLRFPFQKDFIARLEGQTVTGLGRRAKYLMADLTSGDVLLMHLGMSGSFRVLQGNGGKNTPGEFHHPRSEDRAHDHVVFHMSSGASVVFNDPRRFGYMKIIARNALEDEPLLQGLGPEPLGNEFDAAMLAGACAQQEDQPEGGAARPARGGGTWQHLCLRGAVSRPSVAAPARRDAGDEEGRAHRSRQTPGGLDPRCAEPGDQGRRLLDAATIARPRASSAISSIRSRSMTARARNARPPRCGGIVRRFVQNGRSTFWCPKCQK